jgi:hypothetical protein
MTDEEKKALQDGAAVITNKAKQTADKAVTSVKKFYSESDFSNPEYRKDLAGKAKRGFKGFLSRVGKTLEDLGSDQQANTEEAPNTEENTPDASDASDASDKAETAE